MIAKYDSKSNTVTITFAYDPKATYPESKSGKSLLVASTSGNVVVSGTDGALKLGVNAYVSK